MTDIFNESINELKALVSDSEKCANEIFSACENIQKNISVLDSSVAETINSQIARIIEACHFQDFTGQRTTKVISHLKYGLEKAGKIEPKKLSFEESLTQGPQQKTASQEDIDKLFESI
jgi:chemotaxis regulatin CheY-phosphate phosphatase CheZ